MTRWRKFLDRLVLAGAVVLAIVSLIVIVATIRTVRESTASFNDNLTFYVGQVEQEAMQLLDYIDEFSEPIPTKTHSEVLIRFDILWSRVFLDRRDLLGQDSALAKQATETVEAIRATLLRMDPEIIELAHEDSEKILALKAELRAVIPLARALRFASKDARVANQTEYLVNQLRQTYLVFGFILGMTLFGILSIWLLRADKREIKMMNTRLEDRVRQRTQDLQAANRRLVLSRFRAAPIAHLCSLCFEGQGAFPAEC